MAVDGPGGGGGGGGAAAHGHHQKVSHSIQLGTSWLGTSGRARRLLGGLLVVVGLVLIIVAMFLFILIGGSSSHPPTEHSHSMMQQHQQQQQTHDAPGQQSALAEPQAASSDPMQAAASSAVGSTTRRANRDQPTATLIGGRLMQLQLQQQQPAPTPKLHSRDPDSVCLTPGCVRAAAQLLNNLDNRTQPCDDFYQFACGRWIETQLIPDEKSALSVFSQNTADLNAKLRALIERPPADEDPPIVGQMRNMYRSCMNLTEIETRGDEPLLEVLRYLGGWPVLASAAAAGGGDGGGGSGTESGGKPPISENLINNNNNNSNQQLSAHQLKIAQQQQQQQPGSLSMQARRRRSKRTINLRDKRATTTFRLIASSRRSVHRGANTNNHRDDHDNSEHELAEDEDEVVELHDSDSSSSDADDATTTPTPGGGSRRGATINGRQAPADSSSSGNSPEEQRNRGGASAPVVVVEAANWLDLVIKFRQRGFSHDIIIDLSVVPDMRNSRQYIIELDQSSLGLPDRSYYAKGLDDSTVAAYYKLMVESAVLLGAPRPEARRQMAEALEFESSLARISIPREQRRNISRLYNKMPARQLYQLAPNIDWARYLRSLLKDEQLDLDRDQVIVKVPRFLQQLDQLLMATEARIVANYMIWRIVRHSMSGLGRKWRELAHQYNLVITGRQVEEPRWEQCLGSLDGTLGTALSALYVKNHFNQRSKETALEMVDYMRDEFLRILNEIDWMDEQTRQEARTKALAISAYIGYPDELLDDALIEQLYAGLSLSRTNFYQNVRQLRIWSTDYAFNYLRRPNKRGDWKKHARAAVVNAYYNSLENSIEFPAGILQGAFFDADRPQYMNFGAIGYVIGHEITHGFDDRGRQFDSEGNDRNWWKSKTDARFKERAQCIIEQYGNYSLGAAAVSSGGGGSGGGGSGESSTPLRVNGINTQGENIADNGGIKQAFRAYRRWTKAKGREQRLPGLAYSPDQLFWISAASIWCGKFRPEVLKLRINSGVHSPARFRIIGPLSNSPEFAQSFNCPLGSTMNPVKKCSVW